MPPAFWDDAAESAAKDKPRQMDAAQRKRRTEPALCPTDDDAITLKRQMPQKQSLEYVWRSGLAGGMAGCAVRRHGRQSKIPS
jgi:solute carrier family 25 (mitochondrial carrier protein), member 16